MRYILIGAAALLVSADVATAQDYSSSGYCSPWCLSRRNAQDCSYHTFEQCRVSGLGVGGSCVQNPFLSMCTRPKRDRPRR